MTIKEPDYPWLGKDISTVMKSVDTIILHHAGGNGMSALDIDRDHRNKTPPWAAIGYHYYIRKDGGIYRGRPESRCGAHAGKTNGYNTHSIGICFEGNYEIEKNMPPEQLRAGHELLWDILNRYGELKIGRHKDVSATPCPGKYFPFVSMTNLGKMIDLEDDMTRYSDYSELPDWGKPTIDKLIQKEYLKGNEKGLDLSEDMLRILVINDRAGAYDK